MGVWNRYFMLKHIWDIFLKKDTIWVKWVADSAWFWVRVKAWSDPWLNGGSLEDLPQSCKKYLRRNGQLSVADLRNEANGWTWPVGLRAKKETLALKAQVDSLQLIPNVEDSYI
ncbi:hypothetical protein LIER_37556 [Lithospermum erythrorhizon]|uniref:Uncharacterized protein n=1 Tax=Lithospermum erythrorhizon TaxID=34254 RepID=A0AAV3PM13_LITER